MSTSVTDPTEAGYTTTEFWGTLAGSVFTVLVGVYAAFGGHITDAQKTAVMVAIPVIITAAWSLYGLYRTLRKNNTTTAIAPSINQSLSVSPMNAGGVTSPVVPPIINPVAINPVATGLPKGSLLSTNQSPVANETSKS